MTPLLVTAFTESGARSDFEALRVNVGGGWAALHRVAQRLRVGFVFLRSAAATCLGVASGFC